MLSCHVMSCYVSKTILFERAAYQLIYPFQCYTPRQRTLVKFIVIEYSFVRGIVALV